MNDDLIRRLRELAHEPTCQKNVLGISHHCDCWTGKTAKLAAAALEAASRNERRYLWLRKYAESVTGLHLNWYCDELDNWGDNSPSFDAAIDSALASETRSGEGGK